MPHKNKEDYNAWRKKWWASRPDMREKQRVGDLGRARELRKFLADYKVKVGCVDCGYNQHPAALDFDHVTGEKSLLVSSCKSIDAALKEMEKCEVRCSNCHRVRSWERRWGTPKCEETTPMPRDDTI